MFTKNNEVEYKKLDIEHLMLKFKYEIKYLEGYLSFTGALVNDKRVQLEEEMYKDANLLPENESIILDLYENEGKSLLCYYHHSAIVLIYSVLETVLSDICDEVYRTTRAKFSHNDLSTGNLINKSKDYLEITSDLDFSLISGEWAEVGKYQKLRNMIVHQNSFFTKYDEKSTKQKQSIKNNFPSIEISDVSNRFYILDDKILLNFIKLVEKIIFKIFNHVKNITFQTKCLNKSCDNIIGDIPF